MTRAKERTQKLNELIVGAVLHAVLAHLYSRLVLWPEPLQRLKHDNLLCGWASDEHSKVSSWTVSVAWKYFSTSLQRKSLSHHFEVVFNSLNAFPLIASKWQQLHGNGMGLSHPKGNHPPQDTTERKRKTNTPHKDRLRLWFVRGDFSFREIWYSTLNNNFTRCSFREKSDPGRSDRESKPPRNETKNWILDLVLNRFIRRNNDK